MLKVGFESQPKLVFSVLLHLSFLLKNERKRKVRWVTTKQGSGCHIAWGRVIQFQTRNQVQEGNKTRRVRDPDNFLVGALWFWTSGVALLNHSRSLFHQPFPVLTARLVYLYDQDRSHIAGNRRREAFPNSTLLRSNWIVFSSKVMLWSVCIQWYFKLWSQHMGLLESPRKWKCTLRPP